MRKTHQGKINVSVNHNPETQTWREIYKPLIITKNDNFSFKHDGTVYIFNSLQEGRPVLKLQDDKWIPCGHINKYHEAVLGDWMTYQEYMNLPENMARMRKNLQNLAKSFKDMRQ